MIRARIKAIVRQFAENGMKLLLEDPRNVRDLLLIQGAKMLDLIDFDHMTRLPTSFVQRDFRHVEADVVLCATCAGLANSRKSRRSPSIS